MIHLNSPRGLGDAIHVRAIVLYLLAQGESVTVFTRWPEVFDDLDVTLLPAEEASRHRDLFSARACFQCMVPSVRVLSQFRNACLQAGVYDPIELSIDWIVKNKALLEDVRHKADRPILIFQPLKFAGNPDEEARRPNDDAFRALIAGYGDYFRVKVGHPQFAKDDDALPCDLDLFGKTTVTDAIDIITIADLVCSEPSFLGVLAQAFDKRLVCMFSRRGLRSSVKRVAGVTPQRVFHKTHLTTAVYDEA